jgi:CRP-like cAMP-binding protein
MSFEKEVNDNKVGSEKVDIGLLKFFWQTNPFLKSAKNTIPSFLKKLEVFKNFTDFELWELSKRLHKRNFDKGEIIFNEADLGVGFYFIVSGAVDIVAQDGLSSDSDKSKVIVSLERNDYFGELAMLQDRHLRNAAAVAKEPCQLLGFFKPDLDTMIHERPVVASKLLQSVSLIVANRLYSVTQEVRKLKDKIKQMEEKNEASE